jgi:hypothetical protein
MTNVWHEALNAIEFHLVLTQAALAAGTPPPPPRTTTFPTEALPPELADRARALLALTHQLESTADGRLRQLRVALGGMPVRAVAAPKTRTGTFVDVGA